MVPGLAHRINIYRRPDKLEEGTITPDEARQTLIYQNRLARVARMDPNKPGLQGDLLAAYGLDQGEYWRVIVEYSPKIEKEDFVSISKKFPEYAGWYKVVWLNPQILDSGFPHHTSLIIEKETIWQSLVPA